jgi:glycerol-3-phosphate dehydrogenase
MQLVGRFVADPRAADRVVAGLPYRRVEVTRAAESEMARTLDDVLRRRVPVAFRHPDGGASVAPEVAALVGRVLGWNAAETAAAVERYCTGVAEERRRRAEPPAPAALESRRRA